MNAKELAQRLNGREVMHEITTEEAEQAREDGLVVVYGASDDLVEFEGAIDDEVGAGDGTTIHVNVKGMAIPVNECREGDECPHWEQIAEDAKKGACKIEAIWDEDERDTMESEMTNPDSLIPWTFKTEIPHETFDIVEHDDGPEPSIFCRGIVFALKDATPKET